MHDIDKRDSEEMPFHNPGKYNRDIYSNNESLVRMLHKCLIKIHKTSKTNYQITLDYILCWILLQTLID